MSKRTPASSKTPSDSTPKTSRRTTPAADATTPDAPKATGTRRKAQPPVEASVAAETAAVTVTGTTFIAAPVARKSPSHEEIATRAYYIALERGFGDPLADWLTAERELTHA